MATELEGDQSWTLWKQLIDQTDILMALVDENGTIVAASNRMASIGGVAGSKCCHYFHSSDNPPIRCALRRAAETGKAEEEVYDRTNHRWWKIKVISLTSESPRRFLHLVEDVTGKHKLEVGLKRSQEYFRLIFDNSADPIFIHQMNGTIIDANEVACELLGMRKEELVGRQITDFRLKGLYPDPARLKELERTGRTVMETVGYDRAGRAVCLELSIRSLEFDDDIILVTSARDVTLRKESEARHALSENRLRTLFEQIGVAIARISLDGRFIDVNERFTSLLGYGRDEIVGLYHHEFLDPRTSTMVKDDLDRLLKSRKPIFVTEHRITLKEGSQKWVRVTLSLVNETPEAAPDAVVVLEDIEQNKRAEEFLRQSQANFKAIVNDQTELICRFTPDGTLTFANEAYCRYFRARAEELVGHPFIDGISDGDRGLMAERLSERRPDDPLVTYEHSFTPLYQPTAWLRWTDRVMFGEDGRISEVQSVGLDITDRVRHKRALLESEDKLRNIVESTNDIVWEIDNGSFYTYVSGRVHDSLGFEPDELIGRSFFDLMTFDQAERTMTLLAEVLERRNPLTDLELEMKRKDGGRAYLTVHIFPLTGEGGQIKGFRGVSKDITEKKRTEDALRQSEERFRSLVQNSLDIIAVLTTDGDVKYVSPSSLLQLGYLPEDDLVGKSLFMFLHPEDIGLVKRSLDRLRRDPSTMISAVFRLRCRDGRWVAYEGVGTNMLSEAAVGGLVINARDITERKRSEEALQRKDEILEAISLVSERLIRGGAWSESIGDVMEVMGDATKVDRVHVYELLEKANGTKQVYLRHEWTSQGTDGIRFRPELDGFDLRKTGLAKWEDTLLIGGIVQACVSDLRGPGQKFLLAQGVRSTMAVPILVGYELWGYISLDDVEDERRWSSTEIDAIRAVASTLGSTILRERASLDLEMEKERLAVTLRSITDGVITTDIHGDIVLMNNAAEDMLGHDQEEVEGRPVRQVFRFEDGGRGGEDNPVYRVLKNGERVDIDSQVVIGRNKRRMNIEASAAPIRDRASKVIGAVLVFRDVTTRKAMEEELVKSQRLESVGVLAGGIAHDFNNIMTAILGNIALAKSWCRQGDRVMEKLLETEKATLRARDLTQQLLTFSKGGAPIKQAASISEVVHDTIDFSLSGSRILAHYDIPEDIWAVHIDPGQISQVIENLITNAKDAMPDGGRLDITARNVTLGCGEHPNLASGNYVQLSLRDYGTGIPPENLGKIFEPYFTTKSKGTGLGLAVVYSVIGKHDGHIDVQSEVGKGTAFRILLPATAGSISPETSSREAIAYGKGRVLLMDDEEFILDVTGEVLRSIGYEVELARDGKEAVDAYRRGLEEGRRFDAVIVDLTIPGGMGGKEAVKELLKLDPGVKAIVSSGYSSDATMADFRRFGFSGVIPKPYKIEDLSRVMQDVISEGNGSR